MTSYEHIEQIFAEKNNLLHFLLVYYTGHTSDDKQLVKSLEKVRFRRLVCIIDCCRADEVQLIPDKKECIRVVLRSSEGTATASPVAGSTFTRYYLAALRSAIKCPCQSGVECQLLKEFREKSLASGFVTLDNLFKYAADHMERQKPRQDVVSYTNSKHELAFFNQEPIVYSLQFVQGNKQFPDVEIEEQKIDFSASFKDIYEQLRQEIIPSLFNQGLYDPSLPSLPRDYYHRLSFIIRCPCSDFTDMLRRLINCRIIIIIIITTLFDSRLKTPFSQILPMHHTVYRSPLTGLPSRTLHSSTVC